MLSKENDLAERVMVAEGKWKRVERRGRGVEARKKSVSTTGQGKERVSLEKVRIG